MAAQVNGQSPLTSESTDAGAWLVVAASVSRHRLAEGTSR